MQKRKVFTMTLEMPNEISPGAMLAFNMKILRKELSLSQDQLSERSGVPRSTIASLERGEGNPTLQVLIGLAQGLGVTIAGLLAVQKPKALLYSGKDFQVLRKNLISSGKKSAALDVDVLRLTPPNARYLVMEKVVLKAGERFSGTPHAPGTEEYFFTLSGVFEIEVGTENFTVNNGELLCFDGNQKHIYSCPSGKTEAQGLSILVQIPRL